MLNSQFILTLAAKLVVVFFAGAGGSCTGIEQALQRHVDIAANHNEQAVSCHAANHPQTRHHIEDVRVLCPRQLTGGQPVGYFHASPDCTHFSQAKGGQPRSKAVRSLPWVVVKWAGTVQPDVITLENVKEIQKWGRLIAKRDKATGRVIKLDGTVAAKGERVPVREQFLVPDPKHAGRTWRRYIATLRGQGYSVEYRVLCAADFGVPTTRSRLFLIARRDGQPIVWPEPTHFKNPKRGQKRWVAAHTCIDFNLPSQSIFERKRPLADATLRRVARGMKKFVLDSADPFIVPVTHTKMAHAPAHSIHDQAGYGEREGQAPRTLDLEQPLGTVVAGGQKHALVTAFVEQANGGFYDGAGQSANDPISTITTTGSQQRLVSATLVTNTTGHAPTDLRDPAPTLTTGHQQALVEYHLSPEHEAGALRCAAFLLQYYSEGGQWSDLRDPINSITTRDRLALVTVWLKGAPYVVVDICLRMLTPRELANASIFPPQYILSHGHDGRMFSKSQQVFFIGNAVPPLLQKVVTEANYRDLEPLRAAA